MISYCKNGKSAQVLACPQEKLNEILDSPEVAVACQKLTTVDHDSDEAKTLKQGLPLLMFLANYTDGRRHPTTPTGADTPRVLCPRIWLIWTLTN